MLMDISSLEAGRLKGSFQQVNLGVSSRDVAVCFLVAVLLPHEIYKLNTT